MNRVGIALFSLFLLATLCVAQTPSAPAAEASAAIGHGAFPVKVDKTLDSSKLKENESIEFDTVGSFKLADGTLVPKGSKVIGHVVSAKARSKGDTGSELKLAFDKLNIQGGKQLSLQGKVQAIYPPAEEPMGPNMSTMGTSAGGSAHGSTVGGGGVSSGGVGITNSTAGADAQSGSGPQVTLDTKATGVQGMRDLQLEDGMVFSKSKNVKLGSGVRIVVQAQILG